MSRMRKEQLEEKFKDEFDMHYSLISEINDTNNDSTYEFEKSKQVFVRIRLKELYQQYVDLDENDCESEHNIVEIHSLSDLQRELKEIKYNDEDRKSKRTLDKKYIDYYQDLSNYIRKRQILHTF